jgi:hypothetical protein
MRTVAQSPNPWKEGRLEMNPDLLDVVDLDTIAVVRFLNRLKRRKLIPDYVIIGGIAALRYTEPRETKDVDIVILADDLLREFLPIWSRILAEAGGQWRGQLIYVEQAATWLDVMETGRDPLHEEILRAADVEKIENLRVKVAKAEYLLLLALMAWRPDPDRSRAARLAQIVPEGRVRQLLQRYDNAEQTLTKRYDYTLLGFAT